MGIFQKREDIAAVEKCELAHKGEDESDDNVPSVIDGRYTCKECGEKKGQQIASECTCDKARLMDMLAEKHLTRDEHDKALLLLPENCDKCKGGIVQAKWIPFNLAAKCDKCDTASGWTPPHRRRLSFS